MWIRGIFYFLFSIGAAPIESWVYYLNGLGENNIELKDYPWTHGLLYVLSILLLAETIFRLTHHWTITSTKAALALTLVSSIVSLMFAFGFYSYAERLRIINHDVLIDDTGMIQNVLVAISIILAWISFILLERYTKKKVKPKRPTK